MLQDGIKSTGGYSDYLEQVAPLFKLFQNFYKIWKINLFTDFCSF